MRVIFWTRQEVGTRVESDWRETNLAKAIQNGARAHGDEVEILTTPDDGSIEVHPCDLVCKVGVKSRHWFTAYAEAGIPWLYFDKGYIRERAPDQWLNYWRMSVNSHHPIEYLAKAKHGSNRANGMGFRFTSWQEDRGRHIVLDGGSEKNFKFNGIVPESADIGDVDAHCRKVVRRIQACAPGRPIIYRPKPSSKGRQAIEGSEFARNRGVPLKDLGHDLDRAWAVVTYNGAICYDANRVGVPSIVLGSGPARPISSTSLEELENPRLASSEERRQWINNLAWCQFKMREIRDGVAWSIVKEMLDLTPIKTPAGACPCSPL